MSVTADCELLGRGPVQGSADSDSLAALVRQLCKQQQRDRLPGRRCTVSCGRDSGLEIVPYHRKRPDDEGFESDEDLASLGSYEDPSKRKISGGGSELAAASVAAGAGSDSANSSGVSEDSDDADAASLREQAPPAVEVAVGRETYGLADVAFCHTDEATLPGVAVWVIRTRRTSAAVGLEAIVVRSRDNKLQDVCRAYQEHSRRLKLEPKPWSGGGGGGGGNSGGSIGSTVVANRRKGPVTLTVAPEMNRYNLVQRTDTDGVTHIEVTAGPVVATAAARASPDLRRTREGPPSSIISISTPESSSSPRSKSQIGDDEEDDEGAATGTPPPQRPERRKYKSKPESGDENGMAEGTAVRRQQKVVRGQFIRVNVNHCAVLPPVSPESERKPTVQSESKPTVATVSDRLWSTADYDRLDGRYEDHRRSSRPSSRTRSRSTGPGRRQQPLQLAPVGQQQHCPPVTFSRYSPPTEQQPSFGTRFFGKLREITSGNNSPLDLQPVAFRRRNSVGESATANFYQYFGHHHPQYSHYLQHQQHQQRQQQAANKSGGNLKSVIKKNNKSQPFRETYDEPKKVTFSAYATVQVVD